MSESGHELEDVFFDPGEALVEQDAPEAPGEDASEAEWDAWIESLDAEPEGRWS